MTILVLSNNIGGLYVFRKEVIKALKGEGHHVVISAPFEDNAHFFEEMGCELNDTHFDRKGMNPIKDIGLILYYRKLIKQV